VPTSIFVLVGSSLFVDTIKSLCQWVLGSAPIVKIAGDLLAVGNAKDLQFYQVSCGFNSKRLQTSAQSLSLSDFKFDQVGHGFNSEIQRPSLIVTSTLTPFANHKVGINLASLFKMSGRGGRNNGRGGRGSSSANRGG
jgi:hypothetical protein